MNSRAALNPLQPWLASQIRLQNRNSQPLKTVIVGCAHLERFPDVPIPRPVVLVAKLETLIEEWSYLDEDVLLKTCSRKVCLTCQWFRHHARVNCIPVLTWQLHQGWTEDMTRQQAWASEVA